MMSNRKSNYALQHPDIQFNPFLYLININKTHPAVCDRAGVARPYFE